jgi:ribulose-phosphate 3-epimerase
MVIPGIFEETVDLAVRDIKLVANVAPVIQLDIADGLLVDGKTFLDLSFLLDLQSTAAIQLHLMVQKPEAFLLALPPTVRDVCAQVEAFMYNPSCMASYVNVLKAKNVRVGLSFNPQTPVVDFADCISQCDYVQLMTVQPGGQGRAFDARSLSKLAQFKRVYPATRVQVDGGIATDTLQLAVEAGADDVVAGAHIFASADPAQTYKDFVLQFDHARTAFLSSATSTQNQ